MLLAAVAGFNKLVYLYCSLCLHGIDTTLHWVVLMLGMQYVANC